MTDLESKEAFEKWFKKNFHDLHEAIRCGDLVAKNYKKAMFKAWSASAQREGFKLVSLEPSKEMIKHAEQLYISEGVDIFSAVINAV